MMYKQSFTISTGKDLIRMYSFEEVKSFDPEIGKPFLWKYTAAK